MLNLVRFVAGFRPVLLAGSNVGVCVGPVVVTRWITVDAVAVLPATSNAVTAKLFAPLTNGTSWKMNEPSAAAEISVPLDPSLRNAPGSFLPTKFAISAVVTRMPPGNVIVGVGGATRSRVKFTSAISDANPNAPNA